MHQYEFIEKVKNMGLYIITPLDVARLAGISLDSAYVFITRLIQNNRVKVLQKGKVAISNDIFVIASQLIFPSYLSFSTALYLHGVFSQIVDRMYVVSSRKHRSPIKILKTPIQFVLLKPHHIFGYRKEPKEHGHVFLADIEKALVDGLYMPKHLPIGEIASVMQENPIDEKLFQTYAVQMQSEVVIRRAGYLLEKMGYDCELHRNSNTVYRLNPQNKNQGIFNAKWRLYINEVI